MGECMINQNEQFPKIRFHNYCDEWKQQKLGEVFEQTVEYVDPCEQNLELWSVTVESGLTPKEERYNREFLVKKSDKFKKLYPEEIVYNPMNITIGAVGFNNSGKEVAVSGYYVTMKMKSKFSNKFFSAWLSCPKAIRLYKIYSTGSLIERQRVQFPTLSDIKDYFPTFDEQSAIGSLFRTIDDLLASYKENLTNYQSLKVTMLSKMFPKAGQTVPEIRLDGFEGEWEIKRADEIFKSVSKKNKASLPVLSASQIDGMVLRDEIGIDIKYDEATLNNYKVVKPGQFVIHLRSFQGGFALSKLEGITSPAYTIIDFIDKENNLPDFWNSILTSRDFIKRLETVTYGIRDGKSISFKDFSSLKFVFPNFKEQQAISAYFSNLDNLINSYHEKISQLEILKKKLLQDMFI